MSTPLKLESALASFRDTTFQPPPVFQERVTTGPNDVEPVDPSLSPHSLDRAIALHRQRQARSCGAPNDQTWGFDVDHAYVT